MRSIKILTCLFVLVFTIDVYAAIFNITVTSGGVTASAGYSKAEDVIDAIKVANLSTLIPSYSPGATATISVDFRGLPMTLEANGNIITLNIPAISLNRTFEGSSPDDAQSKFKSWLKSEGGSALNALMKKLAELSPHDSLAGNPTSLMGKMVDQDFNRGANANQERPAKEGGTRNMVELAVKVGRYKTKDGHTGENLTLPLSYTIKLDSDPRKQLIFDFPISYYQVDEAKSYNVHLGVAFKFPVTDNWFLTPAIGTGVVGSIDLASVGQIIAGSITSEYSRKVTEKIRVGMGNMVGQYQTQKLKIGDYESDPGISNTVLRNGILASYIHPFLFNLIAETELFFLDTRYLGDALYMDQYNEIGFSIGTNKDLKSVERLLRFGFSLLLSNKTKGWTFNFGYSF